MPRLSAERQGKRAYVKRRKFSRRRFRGSRKARRKALWTKRIAKSVVSKALRKKAETKQFVLDVSAQPIGNPIGYVARLNDIPQGVTDATRIGDTAQMRTLKLNYQLTWNETLGGGQLTRCIVAMFPRGTDPITVGIASVLQNADDTRVFNSPYRSLEDIGETTNTNGPYRILYDQVQELNPTKVYEVVKATIPLNKTVKFSSTSGADKYDNTLVFFAICEDEANPVALTYNSRIYYTDS